MQSICIRAFVLASVSNTLVYVYFVFLLPISCQDGIVHAFKALSKRKMFGHQTQSNTVWRPNISPFGHRVWSCVIRTTSNIWSKIIPHFASLDGDQTCLIPFGHLVQHQNIWWPSNVWSCLVAKHSPFGKGFRYVIHAIQDINDIIKNFKKSKLR